MPIFSPTYFDPTIFDTGGGGGSPGPVTFGGYQWVAYNFVGYATHTFTGLAIGAAASDRWVIAAVFLNHDTSRSLASVSIGGNSAALLYAAPTLSASGGRWEFWKANVPAGTTADVAVTTASGVFFDGACATYTCAGEPTFFDGEQDGTYTGTTFSVAIDVPEGGAVIALASNDGAGVLSAWAGATADSTDNTEQIYLASEDQLTAQTGRTVSFTSTAASGSTGFFGMAALSISVPAVGGGGGTATAIASGTLPLTGAASAQALVQAQAAGSLPLTGAANAQAPAVAQASGSLPLTGAAVGQAPAQAQAGGVLPLTGTATAQTGTAATAQASGVLPLTGSAQAKAEARAGAAGALPLTGAASVQAPATASTSGSLPLTGGAVAQAPARAQAGGSLPIGGSAGAQIQAKAQAGGALPLSGSAVALALAQGQAGGVLPLSGAAEAVAGPLVSYATGRLAFATREDRRGAVITDACRSGRTINAATRAGQVMNPARRDGTILNPARRGDTLELTE